MNVRFIDTSVMMNILDIPGRNQDRQTVLEEFKKVLEANEVLILPIATIIESGNHIAHIRDGNIRRERAIKFKECLENTAKGLAPWNLYEKEISREDLLAIAQEFPEKALVSEMGIGDLSIIRAYENYKKTVPAVGRIMIWSLDCHLRTYSEDVTMKRRKDI